MADLASQRAGDSGHHLPDSFAGPATVADRISALVLAIANHPHLPDELRTPMIALSRKALKDDRKASGEIARVLMPCSGGPHLPALVRIGRELNDTHTEGEQLEQKLLALYAVLELPRRDSLARLAETFTAESVRGQIAALDQVLPGEGDLGVFTPDLKGVRALTAMIFFVAFYDPPAGDRIVKRILQRLDSFAQAGPDLLELTANLYAGRSTDNMIIAQRLLYDPRLFRAVLDACTQYFPVEAREWAAIIQARSFVRGATSILTPHLLFTGSTSRAFYNPDLNISSTAEEFLLDSDDHRAASGIISELLCTARSGFHGTFRRTRPFSKRHLDLFAKLEQWQDQLWYLYRPMQVLAQHGPTRIQERAAAIAGRLHLLYGDAMLRIADDQPEVAPIAADRIEESDFYRQAGGQQLAPFLRHSVPPTDPRDDLPTDEVISPVTMRIQAFHGYGFGSIRELEFWGGNVRGMNLTWGQDFRRRASALAASFPIERFRLRETTNHVFWRDHASLWRCLARGPVDRGKEEKGDLPVLRAVDDIVLYRSTYRPLAVGWPGNLQLRQFVQHLGTFRTPGLPTLVVWLADMPTNLREQWHPRVVVQGGEPPHPGAVFGAQYPSPDDRL